MTIRLNGKPVEPNGSLIIFTKHSSALRLAIDGLFHRPTPYQLSLTPDPNDPNEDKVSIFSSSVHGGEIRDVRGRKIKDEKICKENNVSWSPSIERR